MDCIFCKIVEGNIPSYKLYEDDKVLVFLDAFPSVYGHTLIIPKEHYKDLDDINSETLNHIMKISKKIKKQIEEKINCDGMSIQQNNGDLQEVKHYHLHLKPFFKVEQPKKSVEEVYEILKK